MDPVVIGIIGFIVLFIILFAGIPIGFGMGLIGFIGLIFVYNTLGGALNDLGIIPFTNVFSYTMAVLPLFVLMGEWAYTSGLSDGAYTFMHKLFGGLRGGLAISTIGACAIFAACTGSSLAGAATMTRVALPSMLKYKYDPALATGAIAAGGTLGILIPPSNPMIVFGILTNISVGKLFMGGVVPGILLTLMFIATILIMTKLNPNLTPKGEKVPWREVLSSAKSLWAGVFLALAVLVGLWGGIFSPSEAGGIGAFIALIIIVIRKGFYVKGIIDGVRSTTKTTAMIFTIVIGAMVFSQFMTVSGLPTVMVNFLQGLTLSPTVILIIIMLIYLFLGCILDSLAMILLTLPIVFPVITGLHINPVFFGVLLTLNVEMSLITPPVGMVVYVIAGMVKEIPMYTIFRGIWPFLGAMIVCMALLIAFPNIILWLPNSMIK